MAFRVFPGDRMLLAGVGLFLLFLLVSPVFLHGATYQGVFAEGGLVETVSFAGWLIAAAMILFRVRPLGARAVSFAALSLAFAAREADWQKKFTTEGVLRTNYYENAAIPLLERAIAGAVVLVLLVGLLYAAYATIRFLFFERGWEARSGVWLFATGACLVLGKSLDRLPAELRNWFGIETGEAVVRHLGALEEGLEALAPLVFLWSIWLSAYGNSYLCRRDAVRPEPPPRAGASPPG